METLYKEESLRSLDSKRKTTARVGRARLVGPRHLRLLTPKKRGRRTTCDKRQMMNEWDMSARLHLKNMHLNSLLPLRAPGNQAQNDIEIAYLILIATRVEVEVTAARSETLVGEAEVGVVVGVVVAAAGLALIIAGDLNARRARAKDAQ
jgi:hypothetical protein